MPPNTLTQRKKKKKSKATNNAYEPPSKKQIIWYHHAMAGFPTKATWIKAIKAGFYATWPMLTTAAANKYFSEFGKMQKGHM